MNNEFEKFTESAYIDLIKAVSGIWDIVGYDKYELDKRICIVRHDIDFSPQRAVKMAEAEADEGIKTTYFINMHSVFYNIFETDVSNKIKRILALGHNLGLHFDPDFYIKNSGDISFDDIRHFAALEKNILTDFFECDFTALSFHNPDTGSWKEMKDEKIAGMINTYNPCLINDFKYISDSNGYWRFQSPEEIINSSDDYLKLHILIHPAWWTEEVISPYEKIQRCVNGRGENVLNDYNSLLEKCGRKNIGS